jgi:hypothetical protein
MYNPWDGFGPERPDKLKGSWAGLFREHILENLPIELMAPYLLFWAIMAFASQFLRPKQPVNALN